VNVADEQDREDLSVGLGWIVLVQSDLISAL